MTENAIPTSAFVCELLQFDFFSFSFLKIVLASPDRHLVSEGKALDIKCSERSVNSHRFLFILNAFIQENSIDATSAFQRDSVFLLS